MKKLTFIIAVIAAFAVVGCSAAEPVNGASISSGSSYVSADAGGKSEGYSSSVDVNKSVVKSSEASSVGGGKSSANGAKSDSVGKNSESSLSSYDSGTEDDSQTPSVSGDLSDPLKPERYAYTLKNAEMTGTQVSPSISAFSAEGYGRKATGGGNLKAGDAGYVRVSTAGEFLKAISRNNVDDKSDDGFRTRPMVVEVINDINLGWNEVGSAVQAYSDIVQANAPTVHPLLKKTGVSTVYITGRENLTIFSNNGATIRHACFQIRGCDGLAGRNIVIRNLRFEGPWEWDDSGKYDNNDWDIFTIRADKGAVDNVLIDHCTFTKPYDGTIDIKYGATDVTIQWCAFIPYGKSDSEFMVMMNHLETNRSAFANYNAARTAGATFDDMINYASINKKVHLIGHKDDHSGDENICVTFCNNYYRNCTERLPRLRLGKVHVYNCIFDASDADALENDLKSRLGSWPSALSFASNGSLGTNYGKLLMENCYINGINTPLRNNNKAAGQKYVGSCDALYTYYTVDTINREAKYGENNNVKYSGRYTFLGHSTKADGNLMTPFPCTPIPFDTDSFKSELGYEYVLYNPLKLYETQTGNVGCNKMKFTAEQWVNTAYSSGNVSNRIPSGGVKGSTANLSAGRK